MKKSLGFGKSTTSSKAVALATGLAALTLLLIPYIYLYENVTKLMSDTKKIERESPADEGLCRRMCPERINRIYYDDEGAGLGHMKTIIRDLSELAGYLCAKLILPKPSKLLHIRHNFGQKLSDDLLWEDFINITFAGDNEPVIIRDEFSLNRTEEKYKDFHWFTSTNGKWRDDFQKIHAISWNQEDDSKGFVWKLQKKFYFNDLTKEKLPLLTKLERLKAGGEYKHSMMEPIRYSGTEKLSQRDYLCHYTKDDTSPSNIAFIRERLTERIMRKSFNSSFHGLLHLRRGDVIDVCNTSVERIRDYLSCSLNNTEIFGNLTLLMTSDEEDEHYRQSIKTLASDFEHVTILDVDEMIWEIVDEAVGRGELSKDHHNNYFVYEIGNMLRTWKTDGLVKFYLVRRRSMCTDCIPVEERLKALDI